MGGSYLCQRSWMQGEIATVGTTSLTVYREAVMYLIDVVNAEWESVGPVYKAKKNEGQRAVERRWMLFSMDVPPFNGLAEHNGLNPVYH